MNSRRTALPRRTAVLAALALVVIAAMPPLLHVRADSLPQVRLNADSIAPRPIEELTGKSITRDYAYAWQELSQALDENRSDVLDAHFTGFAKDRFTRRITEQKQAGIRVRYVDHGHQVQAFFYSVDGSAMQLLDTAKLEIQILDGGRVIDKENISQQYLVLMTPGADRWYVRSLESLSGDEF
jgi:hypothetical protein